MTDSHKARFTGHLKHGTRCVCGRMVWGNGGLVHFRTCEKNLADGIGWPLSDGMVEGIRLDLYDERLVIDNPNGKGRRPVYTADVARPIARKLGQVHLERRRAGNKQPMSMAELNEATRAAYEEVVAELLAAHNGARR